MVARREVDHRIDVRFATTYVALVVGVLGGAAWWVWSVQGRLPDPIARHWSAGTADGFSALPAILVMLTVLPVIVSLPLALVAILGRAPLALRRTLGGTAMFLVVFIAVLVLASIRLQLDLTDPTQAPAPDLGGLVGMAVGVLVAFGARWAVVDAPADVAARRASGPPPPSAPRLQPDELRLPWRAPPVGIDLAAVLTIGVACVLLTVVAVVSHWWPALLVPVLLVLVGLVGRFQVSIDDRGLTVEGVGRRVLHVPLAEVAEADVVEVDPFWEFGGWGLRVDVAGRVGLVTRKGPALRVRRGDASEVLVTLDDAEDAAATLNTLADQRSVAAG